jgi:hypothetical protein
MKKSFLLGMGCAILIIFSFHQVARAQGATFADSKYVDMGKASLAAMQSGNVGQWLSGFADNARYYWNSGDSLIGKAAITDYWTKRMSDVIQSLNFSNDIWLAVNVTEPQQAVQSPGVWLLGWYLVNAKYKNGKSMMQWTHVDIHFDANDKVDQVIQYLDRAPINAALSD